MNRLFLTSLIVFILASGVAIAQLPAPASAPAWGGPAPAPDTPVPEIDKDAPQLAPQAFRKGLTWKQRREMGLTIRNIRRVMAEMQQKGELVGKSRDIVAAEVMERLVTENPKAFYDAGVDWDWDAILAFIERMIPLIMTLISLFSDAMLPADLPVYAEATLSVPLFLVA